MANYAILESWRDFSRGLSSIQMEKNDFPMNNAIKNSQSHTGWLLGFPEWSDPHYFR